MSNPQTQRRARTLLQITVPMVAAMLLVAACAPAAGPTGGSGNGAQRTGPKVLNMAMQGEPETLLIYGRPSGASTLNYERWHVLHDNLTAFDANNELTPKYAVKVPSLSDGDWKVNPDGTMEVTWKIKPGTVWHDEAPLSAEDFVFGFNLMNTRELAVAELGELLKMSAVRAPDPQTLVVTWKEISFWGNSNGPDGIPAVPRHLLEGTWKAGDYPAVESSSLWNAGWVGIGPFKLTRLEMGSFIEADAFDRYALGRPKIDRVIVHWVGDVNTVVARVLAGAINIVPGGGMLGPEQIHAMRGQWAGKGQAYTEPNSIRDIRLNWRYPDKPWVKDLKFRQAMAQGINKKENLAGTLHYGLTEPGEYFVLTSDPLHPLLEQRGAIKYPYDPTRAQRLFNEAGWTKGPDGLLRNPAGETVQLSCCRKFDADSNDVQESLAIVSELRSMGIDAAHPIPSAPPGSSSATVRQFDALNGDANAGRILWSIRAGFATFISREISTPENAWRGQNSRGYSNLTYDALFERLQGTLKADERREFALQLAQMLSEQLPSVPVFENPQGLAVQNGITGVQRRPPLNVASSFNIHEWDIQ